MTLAMLDSFFFRPIELLPPETNSGNKNSRPSHGLLPVITHLVLVVISLMTEGDFLFPFFLQCLSVGVVPRRNHWLSRLELLQTMPKPHQSRSNAPVPISRTAHVGPSRCGSRSLGSLMPGREKRFSFRFPSCSLICSRRYTAFSSSSICVRVGSCASSSLTFLR